MVSGVCSRYVVTRHCCLSSRHATRRSVNHQQLLHTYVVFRHFELTVIRRRSHVFVLVLCVLILKVPAERFARDRDGRDAGECLPRRLLRVLGHSAPRHREVRHRRSRLEGRRLSVYKDGNTEDMPRRLFGFLWGLGVFLPFPHLLAFRCCVFVSCELAESFGGAEVAL